MENSPDYDLHGEIINLNTETGVKHMVLLDLERFESIRRLYFTAGATSAGRLLNLDKIDKDFEDFDQGMKDLYRGDTP